MIPHAFDYTAPTDLDQALALLRGNPGAAALAGGTNLVPAMTARRAAPAMLVDLAGVAGLRSIVVGADGLHVGAMATYADIAACAGGDEVGQKYRALGEAIAAIGDPQVRNRGTIGGAMASADPAGDLPAAALALDAIIEAANPGESCSYPADAFFTGPGQTVLTAGQIITGVIFPDRGYASAYVKIKNPASGYAICGVAAAVKRNGDGLVTDCRVAVTGATDCPVRLRRVEDSISGRALTAESVTEAAALAADPAPAGQALAFRSDLAATAGYRAHLTGVLVKRALQGLFS